MHEERLSGLDALRGIAAFAVLFGHAASISENAALTVRVHLAVDLFFVLSGYVMARSYEQKLTSGLSEREFLLIRLRRIWPTMAIGAMLGILLWWIWFAPPTAIAVLLAGGLLFIPNLTRGQAAFPVNLPAWSILFELVANFLHATALRHLRVRDLAALTLVSAALLIVFQKAPNPGCLADEFILGLPRVLLGYCLGIIIWRLQRDRALLPTWLALIILPAFLAITRFANENALWIDWSFMLAAAPLCVVAGIGAAPWPRAAAFIGELSFPLYASHGPVLIFLNARGYGMAASILAAIAVAVAVGFLTGAFHRSRKQGLPTRPSQAAETLEAEQVSG